MRGRKSMNSGKEDQGYGLRNNPKKSWRSVAELHQCEICGRAFKSARAVFGHLRHHSGKLRNRSVQCKDSEGLRASLVLESLTVRRKRSRTATMRTPNSSFSSFDGSSSVAETEKEAEVAALSLMLLSRGERDWEGPNPAGGFSDNDSGTFEVQSLHQKRRILEHESGNSVSECGLSLKMMNLDSGVSVSMDTYHGRKLDGYEEIGYGVGTNEEENESKFMLYETEVMEEVAGGLELACVEVGSSENLIQETGWYSEICDKSRKYKCRICNKTFHSHQALGGHQTLHRMNTKICSGVKNVKFGGVILELRKKSKGHECSVCLKVFGSGQALGGHKKCHLRNPQPCGAFDRNVTVRADGKDTGDGEFRPCRSANDCKRHPLLALPAN